MLYWSRYRVIERVAYVAFCLLMVGCVPFMKPEASTAEKAGASITKTLTEQSAEPLGLLSWIGGLAILGGIAALVISSGRIGTRALVIGLGLVLLNYAVSRYADWVFIPVLIGTACISLTYAYNIVRKALKNKESNNV